MLSPVSLVFPGKIWWICLSENKGTVNKSINWFVNQKQKENPMDRERLQVVSSFLNIDWLKFQSLMSKLSKPVQEIITILIEELQDQAVIFSQSKAPEVKETEGETKEGETKEGEVSTEEIQAIAQARGVGFVDLQKFFNQLPQDKAKLIAKIMKSKVLN